MKLRWLLSLSMPLLIFACSKSETPNPNPNPTPPLEGRIDLSDLKVGQKSTFKKYTSTCADLENNFQYTGDVLTLEVIEENGALFLQEYLSEDSPMYIDGSFRDKRIYPINGNFEQVLIPKRDNSSLFFFYANDTIRLNPQKVRPLKQEGCTLMLEETPFIGNDIGFISSFKFGDLEQKGKTVVSCEPFFQLDAYLLYDENQLYMSHVVNIQGDINGNVVFDQVEGWILEE